MPDSAPERTPAPSTSRRAARLWPVVSGAAAVVVTIALGLLVADRASPFEVDTEWMGEIIEHRSPLWEVPALVMNFLGGGWFGVFAVPSAAAIVFLVLRRPWAALYFVLVSAVSAGIVQLLKAAFGRLRPVEMLIPLDSGAFPSGHVANAATIAVSLALILAVRWVWAAGAVWIVLMALSRTYLGVHWFSDTVGGALLGAGVAVILWAPVAGVLERERERREHGHGKTEPATVDP